MGLCRLLAQLRGAGGRLGRRECGRWTRAPDKESSVCRPVWFLGREEDCRSLGNARGHTWAQPTVIFIAQFFFFFFGFYLFSFPFLINITCPSPCLSMPRPPCDTHGAPPSVPLPPNLSPPLTFFILCSQPAPHLATCPLIPIFTSGGYLFAFFFKAKKFWRRKHK